MWYPHVTGRENKCDNTDKDLWIINQSSDTVTIESIYLSFSSMKCIYMWEHCVHIHMSARIVMGQMLNSCVPLSNLFYLFLWSWMSTIYEMGICLWSGKHWNICQTNIELTYIMICISACWRSPRNLVYARLYAIYHQQVQLWTTYLSNP